MSISYTKAISQEMLVASLNEACINSDDLTEQRDIVKILKKRTTSKSSSSFMSLKHFKYINRVNLKSLQLTEN